MSPSVQNSNTEALESIAMQRALDGTQASATPPESHMPEELASALASFRETNPNIGPKDGIAASLSQADERFVQDLTKIILENWASVFTMREEMTKLVSHKQGLVSMLDKHIAQENRPPSEEEITFRNSLLDESQRIQKTFLDTCAQDRDFFYALHGEVLKTYGDQLQRGRIAEVPYVTERVEEILDGLKNNEIVLLHGDTGSGKTETARIAARAYSGGKEPVVVRGYPQMSQEELYGHLALSADRMQSWIGLVAKIDEECQAFDKANPDLSSDERAKKHQLITEIACHENKVTVSEYVLGAHYIAMKEGRVLILDEANAIHPELRRKANELDTKRPREIVTIQEDGGMTFEVAPGYGKIETANLGRRYGEGGNGRHAYTPDEINRRTKIEFDYLPQSIKGGFKDISRAEQKQLFTIALAAMLNPQGNITGPANALSTIWNLCQFAATTQLAFAGRLDQNDPVQADHLFKQGGAGISIPLDVVISPRTLQRILSRWKMDGFRYEIDHYIKKLVLDQAVDPMQKAYLHQLGVNFGFFGSAGWPNNLNYGVGGKLTHFPIESPKNRFVGEIGTTPLMKIVEAVHGEAPARSVWPQRGADANSDGMLGENHRVDAHMGLEQIGALFEQFGFQRDRS